LQVIVVVMVLIEMVFTATHGVSGMAVMRRLTCHKGGGTEDGSAGALKISLVVYRRKYFFCDGLLTQVE